MLYCIGTVEDPLNIHIQISSSGPPTAGFCIDRRGFKSVGKDLVSQKEVSLRIAGILGLSLYGPDVWEGATRTKRVYLIRARSFNLQSTILPPSIFW